MLSQFWRRSTQEWSLRLNVPQHGEAHQVLTVVRLQAREAHISTRVSAMRSEETELQAQLLTLHQENARLNDLMNYLRSASESLFFLKKRVEAAIPDVKFELSRTQIEVSNLRSSMERNQSFETLDAEDLQHVREEKLSQARDNLRHSAEIHRPILILGAPEWETARVQSQVEDAKNCDEHLESRCRPDRCRIRRYHTTDGHTHTHTADS